MLHVVVVVISSAGSRLAERAPCHTFRFRDFTYLATKNTKLNPISSDSSHTALRAAVCISIEYSVLTAHLQSFTVSMKKYTLC